MATDLGTARVSHATENGFPVATQHVEKHGATYVLKNLGVTIRLIEALPPSADFKVYTADAYFHASAFIFADDAPNLGP
jgi:hypothetical protein